MANSKLNLSDSFELGALADEFTHSGYGEFFKCFSPLTVTANRWQSRSQCMEPVLASMVDLFLLNRPVARQLLSNRLQMLLPRLIDLGIIVEVGNEAVKTASLVVLPIYGYWLFCQPPSPHATLYLGEDSIALLNRLQPRVGGETLDLCAGPGILSLHAAHFSRKVTAVELNHKSAKLAFLNVELNRLSDCVEIFNGDLYENVLNKRFDTIVANPPMLPYPDSLGKPVLGSGGMDGMNVTWRILEGLAQALTNKGHAQIIGMTLSDGVNPMILDRLAELSRSFGLTVCMSILSHKGLTANNVTNSSYRGRVINTLTEVSGEAEKTAEQALDAMLVKAGASHLCSFFLHVRIGNGQLRMIDVSKSNAQSNESGLWFI